MSYTSGTPARLISMGVPDRGGWFNMACWNGLSADQQQQLIVQGYLPIGYEAEGDGCPRGAEVGIETEVDTAPGPRFYCLTCAIDYLEKLHIILHPDV